MFKRVTTLLLLGAALASFALTAVMVGQAEDLATLEAFCSPADLVQLAPRVEPVYHQTLLAETLKPAHQLELAGLFRKKGGEGRFGKRRAGKTSTSGQATITPPEVSTNLHPDEDLFAGILRRSRGCGGRARVRGGGCGGGGCNA